MNLIWQELAKLDLEDAANFYDDIDEHLGRRFVAAVEVAIAEIKTWPNLRASSMAKPVRHASKTSPMRCSSGWMVTLRTSSPSCISTANLGIGITASTEPQRIDC